MRTAITGGIGSGKSYVCRLLEQQGISVYDCDSAAKRLMRTSPTLRSQLQQLLYPQKLTKENITRFLLASQKNALALNAIVHPAVIADYLVSGMEWVESAIVFESGLDRVVDRIIVVTAPLEVRIRRVMERDGISPEKAMQWIEMQMPQEEFILKAHHQIINDGEQPLLPQLLPLL